jgi:UDP-3-O-[3-hydroxymyristoyl] N-acetylglucosamine deacetylase
VRLLPAPVDSGVAFRRTDLGITIPARFDTVADTRMCTMIGLDDARVGTIEHLMAALAASGIDNLTVELDGAEVPVLDGSAEPWMFLLDCAGIAVQDAPRRTVEVLRTVRVEDGDAFAELRPGHDGLALALSIEFEAAAIGRQALTLPLETACFRRDLARARTFAMKHEIDGLQRMGMALGGSLDNAVVVAGDRILNPAGLRMPDEFVRHKMLDAVGDLALAGGPLQARFIGHKSGHALNNRVLRALFADAANWRIATEAGVLLAA